MKHTLLNKYIAGETSAAEEHELMLLLQDSSELTNEESTVLQLLQYSNSDSAEEDIFAVDYSEEYNKVVRPRKIIRIWPLVAAACVAAILIVFLTPPKEDVSPIMSQTEIAKAEPQPAATQEKENKPEALIAEAAKTTKEKQPKKTPSPTTPSKMEIEQPSQQAQLAQVDNKNTQQTNDEERQIAEIMRRQEECLLAMQQEMSQTDIRAEITLRGERMRQAHAIFASIEY